MNRWWPHRSIGQRWTLLGLAVLLYLLGMQIWFWGPLNQSIDRLQGEVARLKHDNQQTVQKLASFKTLEGEVIELREELLPLLQHFPTKLEAKAFRKDVVTIGTRNGVTVRLWKPNEPLVETDPAEAPLVITVRVEGAFYDTLQFLNDVLEVSWVQDLENMVMTRKLGESRRTIVTTDLTLYGLTPKHLQEIQELLQI